MPGIVRQTRGSKTPKAVQFKDYASRQPAMEEKFVMEEYRRHASHCSTCSRPYKVFSRGEKLCGRGEAYAKDVLHYIYQPFYHGTDKIQLEFPSGWTSSDKDTMRDLLTAMSEGMTFSDRKPVVSQPSPVDAFRKSEEYYGHGEHYKIIERRPRQQSTRDDVYIEPRGSFYLQDEIERQGLRRQAQEPHIITATPRKSKQRAYYS